MLVDLSFNCSLNFYSSLMKSVINICCLNVLLVDYCFQELGDDVSAMC